METIDLKTLANKVLQRNQQRNFLETKSFLDRKFEGKKVSLVSTMKNRETNRKLFEDLFHSHAEKLKRYALTDAEIQRQRPDLYREIQQAVKAMDLAWLKEDLQNFKTAMERVEAIYLRALQEISEW